MADIELVVKIPEWVYKRAQDMPSVWADSVWSGIKNGTPLPKGHGRLIDADALVYKQTHHGNYYTPFELIDENDLNRAQTIIEADREVEE